MASPLGGGSTRAHLKEYLRRRRTQDNGVSRPSSFSSRLAPLSNAEGELRLAEIAGLIVNHEDAVSAHKDAVAAHKVVVRAHKDAVAAHRLAGHERTLVALRQEQAQLRDLIDTASTGEQPTDTAPETANFNNAQDEGQIVMVEL